MPINLKDQFQLVKPGDVGIFGDPISHSLSPAMHNAAFLVWRQAFHDRELPTATYHKFQIQAGELEAALEMAEQKKMRGVNITIPHKSTVIPFMNVLDPFVTRSGAMNTVVFSSGKRHGFNTDGEGLRKALWMDLDLDIADKKVFILGAGGTARVAALALLDEAVAEVKIWNRHSERARKLVSDLSADFKNVKAIDIPEVANACADADLILNATSVGLKDADPLPVEGLQFHPGQIAYDVIYHRKTEFLSRAEQQGAIVSGGLGMLLYQGARAFEIWTHSPAPLDVMRAALQQSLSEVK